MWAYEILKTLPCGTFACSLGENVSNQVIEGHY